MKKAIYSFIYYHLLGWKTNVTVPNYDKCVICAAPHTTNMDLFIGKLFYGAIGRKTSFMMKKEWFLFPKFHLAITPEGTRKRNPNWKKGFYYIALKAQVPIVLIGIDYNTKTVTSTKAIMPSGDIEKDMREIKLYFKDFKGKHPENFSIGDVE